VYLLELQLLRTFLNSKVNGGQFSGKIGTLLDRLSNTPGGWHIGEKKNGNVS